MATYQYVQNDTAPDMNFTIVRKPSNTAVDITGATVRFKIKDNTSGVRTNDAHSTCTIISPTAGTCSYTFLTGDLPSAGSYSCDLEVTYASGKVETDPKAVTIVARAEA